MVHILTTAAAAGGHEYATYDTYVTDWLTICSAPRYRVVRMTPRRVLNSTGSVG